MLPPDTESPAFFTYGIFKPGQLGYLRIKDNVEDTELGTVGGQLYERNGAAVLDATEAGTVGGFVLLLRDPKSTYRKIGRVEPEDQYEWKKVEVDLQDEHQGDSLEANLLISETGITPREREIHDRHPDLRCQWWDGSDDPLFTHALTRIEEILVNAPEALDKGDPETLNECEAKKLFDLQMGYQLLWTAIERYLLLRYAEEGTVRRRDRNKLAGEKSFQKGVERYLNRNTNGILNLQYPGNEPSILEKEDPEAVLDFYWQLRNNVTHRGKGVRMEYDLLRNSLDELLQIFTEVLDSAFESAKEFQELDR